MSTARTIRVCLHRIFVLALSTLVLFQFCGLNAMAQVSGTPPMKPWPPAQLPRVVPSTGPRPGGVATDYIIGPGDRLTIADYSATTEGEQPIVVHAIVLPDGTVNIHPVGVIHVAGMTLSELNSSVNQLAKKVLLEPDIVITISGTRDMTLYVLGEVEYPGLYQPGVVLPGRLSSGETGGLSTGTAASGGLEPVVQNLTVTALLQEAGGLKDDANVRQIRVTRSLTGQVFYVDLWKLLVDGDSTEDLILQAGDVVFVPKAVGITAEARELGLAVNYRPRVRVWGAVKLPGLYDLKNDDDVLSVLARAGGFTQTAKKRFVVLARVNKDGSVTTEKVDIPQSITDAKSIGRMSVHNGDVVIAADSFYLRHWGHVVNFAAGFAAAATLVFIYALVQRSVLHVGQSGNTTAPTAPIVTVPAIPSGGGSPPP